LHLHRAHPGGRPGTDVGGVRALELSCRLIPTSEAITRCRGAGAPARPPRCPRARTGPSEPDGNAPGCTAMSRTEAHPSTTARRTGSEGRRGFLDAGESGNDPSPPFGRAELSFDDVAAH